MKAEVEQTVDAAHRFNPSVRPSGEDFYEQVQSLESSVMSAYKGFFSFSVMRVAQ
jgi:hypothetical protein